MINKNINNGNLSANYGTTVASPSRKWQARLYSNNTLLSCSIKRLTITKGSCGATEAFSIGNVISSMLTAELLELSTDIKGTDIKVEIGLDTGTVEWICVGKFTAIEVVKTAYSTSVTGYGFTTSKTLSTFTIPATLTLANIASAIQTATGCTVSFGTGITTSYALAGVIESGTSCYGGLQILAHACGGYATDTNDGNIIIRKYDDTATISVSTDRMKELPNVEEVDFTITGVSVTATGQYTYSLTTDVAIDPDKTYYTRSGTAPNYVYTPVDEPDVADIGTYYEQFTVIYTSGSPVVLYDENANMSASVFNNVYSGIVGYAYRTGTIDLSLGDPRIEGNDVLSVADVNGNTYIVPCHLVTHTYDGGLLTTVQAVKATADGDGLVTNAPITQKIDQISTATSIAQASAESAHASAQQAQQSAETALGYAEQAKQTTDEINAYADLAGKTVTQILDDAEVASVNAKSAKESADSALVQLGIVEDVVDVLNWISEHGTYKASTDTAVVQGKYYFTRSGTSPNYTYTVVSNPTGNPSTKGYYELDSVDEAVSNYISSHLALTNQGLWVINDNNSYKILLASDGMYVYNPSGTVVGRYGSTAQIGANGTTRFVIDAGKLQAYDSSGNKYFEVSASGLTFGSYTGATTSDIPTNVSQLNNDSDFATTTQAQGYASTAESNAKNYADTGIISNTTLYYASNSTTAPSKPSAHITTNSASTYGAWNIALPTYNASYPYLYVCTETKTKGGSYAWTSVEQTTYASAISAIKTTADNASSGLTNKADKSSAVASTVSVYYRSTTHSAPSITTSTSIGTSTTTDNAWEYTMPVPKKNCYFYTCERYTMVDGSVSFSTVRELSSETYASKWVSSSDSTYIDGGNIYAHSVTADQIASNTLVVGDMSDGADYAKKTDALSSVTTKDQYYLSTSSSSATGGSWQDTVPTWSTGKYIWTRVATTKTPVSGSATTTYSTAVYDSALTSALSTANSAQNSANGAASTVVTTKQYYLSTSSSSATGGSWSSSVPTWTSGKYIWTRYEIVKTTVGGTATTTYSPSANGVYDATFNAQIESAIDDLIEVKTATGSIVSVSDASAYPALDVSTTIEAVQAGSGTPSPSNPRAISGFSSVKVSRTGKNLIHLPNGTRVSNNVTTTIANEVINASGTVNNTWADFNYFSGSSVKIVSGQSYTVRLSSAVSHNITFRFSPDGTENGYQNVTISSGNTSATFTANNNFSFVRLYSSGLTSGQSISISNLQVFVGIGSQSAFEAYQGDTYTIDLDGTRYGGTLDVTSGVLTVDRALLGSVTWTKHSSYSHIFYAPILATPQKSGGICISNELIFKDIGLASFASDTEYRVKASDRIYINIPSCSNTTELSAWLTNNPLQIVYELATPLTVNLTAQEIELLQGANNVWANCGTTTLDYAVLNSDMLALAEQTGKSNKFITQIGSDGIKVHAEDNIDQNYAKIDANGMEVYKGGTSVAFYGDTARIGKTSSKNLSVGTSGFIFNNNGTALATINADTYGGNAGFKISKGEGSYGIFGLDNDPVLMLSLPTITSDHIPRAMTLSIRALEIGFLGLRIEPDQDGYGFGKVLINGSEIDFVSVQGTSGIWTYRIWNSGVAECWGTYTASIAISTSSPAYGGYRSSELSIPAFPITFDNAPSVTATANSASGYWVNNINSITTTGGKFYLSAGSSLSAANRSIAFHVIGT